jgi:hypothetical protein
VTAALGLRLGAAVFLSATRKKNWGVTKRSAPFSCCISLFFVVVVRVAMMLGVVNAGLVGMLVRMQLMAMRDMRMMGRLFMVACFMVLGGFMLMLGGLFVMMGGLAVMFSTFVSCRHIHVLREVITL